jgi:hypothetical protein
LLSGELGGNLLSKYSMLGRFYATHEALDFLRLVIAAALGSQLDPGRQEQVDAVIDYLRGVLLHCPFETALNDAPMWETNYDVESWSADKYSKPLKDYRRQQPLALATLIEPDKKALIENRLRTFGEHPSGLGKFTRTLFARQLRHSVFAATPDAASRPGWDLKIDLHQ